MKWFKHTISIATVASIGVFLYAGKTIEDSKIIHGSLLFIYWLFVAFTLLMYRVSLIGREKIKWPTLIVAVLILAGLTSIHLNKELFYSLWNITLSGFILLSGDAVFQIIPKNRPLTKVSQIATAILLASYLIILAFEIGSPTLFYFTEFLLMLVTLLLVAGFFVKKKGI